MTIEQLLKVLAQRIEVLEGELHYHNAFSAQWEEFYGRLSELEGLVSILQPDAVFSVNDYLNQAIEERIEEDDEDE